MAVLTFPTFVLPMSVKLILTDWSADWQIGMTCIAWCCHMQKNLFNECPTLWQAILRLCRHQPPLFLPITPSVPFLTLFTDSLGENTTHIITVFPLSLLTGPNKCSPYFSHLHVFFASKGKEKEAVLDYCAQSWYFYGDWGGWAYKDRSAHSNSPLPVIYEREWVRNHCIVWQENKDWLWMEKER